MFITSTDWNNDHKMDIITANDYGYHIAVLTNIANTTGSVQFKRSSYDTFEPVSVSAGDIDTNKYG